MKMQQSCINYVIYNKICQLLRNKYVSVTLTISIFLFSINYLGVRARTLCVI